MSIKVYKPTTAARRQMSIISADGYTAHEPEKSLIVIRKKHSGRNAQGKITVRHKGGGEKRFYRLIDFKRDKFGVPAKVMTLEYDPNRTPKIALLYYRDGEKRYIIAPADLQVGDTVVSSKEKCEMKIGNAMPLEHIPVGTLVHCVELVPGKGAEMVRSAGSWCKLMAIDGGFAHLRLPSTEVRMVPQACFATVGQVSNAEHMHVIIGKAGRMRHMGVKPTVRGKAMNPVDHPHGGGEGSNPIGLKHPKTPWGKPALGVKTRKHHKPSDTLIIQRRKKQV
ncbi:50S ribosomal protein L2 [Candidatus Falkowbacteria bacterium RIFOXYC2_FULL_48_21]|uniref:Large ribosomal subunit protein uL2 n=1 Tax=Candidatus Falkowbacteria bacterium RIFOXYC2_FULL_48_21 TaxID=1798005 RepID=A0A1F5TG73_9BACT|nr:MAG: 50S ribosomal protein L2 [Candidatus Falkowbacteria bacterium RIFOXYC2_FULL_48_21]